MYTTKRGSSITMNLIKCRKLNQSYKPYLDEPVPQELDKYMGEKGFHRTSVAKKATAYEMVSCPFFKQLPLREDEDGDPALGARQIQAYHFLMMRGSAAKGVGKYIVRVIDFNKYTADVYLHKKDEEEIKELIDKYINGEEKKLISIEMPKSGVVYIGTVDPDYIRETSAIDDFFAELERQMVEEQSELEKELVA